MDPLQAPETLLLESHADGVLQVTLNRPDVGNAINTLVLCSVFWDSLPRVWLTVWGLTVTFTLPIAILWWRQLITAGHRPVAFMQPRQRQRRIEVVAQCFKYTGINVSSRRIASLTV